MRISIATLFPEMFENFQNTSIIKRAIAKEVIQLELFNIRKYTLDKNYRVDDYSVGGGAGLIMKCQPIIDCLEAAKKPLSKVIYLSPRGKTFTQAMARTLSREKDLILLCGHYEGIDERILEHVDEMISIGDYILTGGELGAMVLADAIIRLQEGAIKEASHLEESFENGLLEYPQYTLPREFDGEKIPDILFTGNHSAIKKWRLKESLRLTKLYRPDLLEKKILTKEEINLLKEIESQNFSDWEIKALEQGKKFL